jgi:hypothetical protein
MLYYCLPVWLWLCISSKFEALPLKQKPQLCTQKRVPHWFQCSEGMEFLVRPRRHIKLHRRTEAERSKVKYIFAVMMSPRILENLLSSLHSRHSWDHNICSSALKFLIYIYYGSTALCWALTAFSVSWSYTQSVGLLGRGISPSQGLYLDTEQHNHRINAHKYRHPCLEWDSNPRSQRSSELRQFMPWAARLYIYSLIFIMAVNTEVFRVDVG